MKNFLISLSVVMSIGSFLGASGLRYECENDWAKMTFLESSNEGEAYFKFEENDGDRFEMWGGQLSIQKNDEKIVVRGEPGKGSRYKIFFASFPLNQIELGMVESWIVFRDHYEMPLLSPPFSCMVKRVAY